RKSFEQAAVLEVLRIVREVEVPRPSAKLSTLDTLPSVAANRGIEPAKLSKMFRGELDWVLMKALDKDRARRYETPNGFALDVQRYLADEPVHACPPSAGYRLRKFVRRHRSAAIMSAGLAAMAAILAMGGWFYREASREANRTRQVTAAHEKMPLVEAAIRRAQHTKAFDLLNEI